MATLVHICCGPCAITVLQRLVDAGHSVEALFFNPNVHPLAEYLRRREGAQAVCERLGVPFIAADTLPAEQQDWADPCAGQDESAGQGGTAGNMGAQAPYAPEQGGYRVPPAVNPARWLAAVAGREQSRCVVCWRIRLAYTAAFARAGGYDGFCTSLLYSRYQDHDAIRALGFGLAAQGGPAFVHEDFRTSWQEGITLSKAWGIYRQQYCGCIFSEYERYAKALRKTIHQE